MHRIVFVVVATALALVPASSPARAAPLAVSTCIYLEQGSMRFRAPIAGSSWSASFLNGTRYWSAESDSFTFNGLQGKMQDATSIGLEVTNGLFVPATATAKASFTINQKGSFKLKDSLNGVRISIKGVPTVVACTS